MNIQFLVFIAQTAKYTSMSMQTDSFSTHNVIY